MIIFDLEWNSGMYERVSLNEILQIGAVKVDRLGGKFLGSFNAFIKPTVHKRYSPGVAKLPDLALYEESELDFKTAIADFARWCGGDTSFAAWGSGDFGVLKQNLAYWKVEFPIPATYLDLQAAFGAQVGAKGNLALSHAVEYCQIPDVFDYHNSMHDALYTALVSEGLSEEHLRAATRVPGEPTGKGKATAGLPKGRRWIGPFADREELLNNRGCRAGTCPKCGARVRVNHWCYEKEGRYVSRFVCPEHGAFYLFLEGARDKRGRLWGSIRVTEPTMVIEDVYARARKANTFTCLGRRRKGRSRWRRPARKKGGKATRPETDKT